MYFFTPIFPNVAFSPVDSWHLRRLQKSGSDRPNTRNSDNKHKHKVSL